MKKFFAIFSIIAMAIAAVSFVSCSNDDDEEKVPAKEEYLCFKYWLSNDVLDLVDVTTSGIGALTFSNAATYQGVEGKESNLVELTGNQAKDGKFSVKVTLKSNWKEIIATKEKCECYHAHATGNVKGSGTYKLDTNLKGVTYSRERAGEEFEDKVSTYIQSQLGYEN